MKKDKVHIITSRGRKMISSEKIVSVCCVYTCPYLYHTDNLPASFPAADQGIHADSSHEKQENRPFQHIA